jgi:hypothetical protein
MSINKSALRIDSSRLDDLGGATVQDAAPAVATEADKVDPRMRAEIAGYVYQMAGEMTNMARAARLDLLAYFLEMARIEANSQRQQS